MRLHGLDRGRAAVLSTTRRSAGRASSTPATTRPARSGSGVLCAGHHDLTGFPLQHQRAEHTQTHHRTLRVGSGTAARPQPIRSARGTPSRHDQCTTHPCPPDSDILRGHRLQPCRDREQRSRSAHRFLRRCARRHHRRHPRTPGHAVALVQLCDAGMAVDGCSPRRGSRSCAGLGFGGGDSHRRGPASPRRRRRPGTSSDGLGARLQRPFLSVRLHRPGSRMRTLKRRGPRPSTTRSNHRRLGIDRRLRLEPETASQIPDRHRFERVLRVRLAMAVLG